MARAKRSTLIIDYYRKILTPMLFSQIIPDYQLDPALACNRCAKDAQIRWKYLSLETDSLNEECDAHLYKQIHQHKLLLCYRCKQNTIEASQNKAQEHINDFRQSYGE